MSFVHFSGPAAYEPKVNSIQNRGGKMVHKEKRFMEAIKEDVPGPGTYEVRRKSTENFSWLLICLVL